MSQPSAPLRAPRLGDFTTGPRVLLLAAMAILVGSAAVLTAWALIALIALCTNLAYFGRFSFIVHPIDLHVLGYASVAVPVVGCLIVGLMARFGSEKIRGHGIPEAMEAILIGQSRIQPKVAVLKPLSSAISIGTGGPFGAEGPIIMTGGAIGSLFAQCFIMSAAERKTLLVAGAAAGMTAVFGTPIASVLLAVELLLFEWKPRSFIPVLAACLAAAVERGWLLPGSPLFAHTGAMALTPTTLLACCALGLACGLGSGLLTAMVYAAEDLFGKLPIHWMFWPAIGGVAVGLGGLVDVHALGVGYDNIAHLLSGSIPTDAVLRLMIVKAVIWSIALGSGTSGGVLAPLLIMGGAFGALSGLILPHAGVGDWALIGMAAMMGGTMRAPLTATMFAVELTGASGMLVPLIAACGVSYAVTVLLLRRSILTEKVVRRGYQLMREYHVDPLDLASVSDVMVSRVDTLPAASSVADAVEFFSADLPRHKAYPVVDEAGRPVAMLSRADVLQFTRDKSRHEATLAEVLAGRRMVTGAPDEPVSSLVEKMVRDGAGRVPIVRPEDGVLVGIVARKDLLRVRARRLAEERDRRAYFGFRRARIAARRRNRLKEAQRQC
jgi:CIC family chloride channel protein